MDFRIGRTVVSPSSSSSSGLLYPPAAPHSLTPTPIFYYPGLPLKLPPSSPHSSPLLPASGLNGNHHRTTSCTTSSVMMRSTATVQPSALHPPIPQSSPHLHRVAPGSSTVVSPPSSGTSVRHQHNGGSSNNSNSSSSSSSNSSSSSFAAALRHLAKQAGGPTQSTIHSDQEIESSPNRSSYNGPTHGYAHTYNGDTVTKSPSPSCHYRSTPKRDSGHTKNRREEHPHIVVTTRSRSPPVVTITPTLSLSNLQYQDSRKAYDRAMLCHTVPSSGGFNGGGLSTGLAGLHSLPSMVANASPFTTPTMMATSISPASSNNDYARTSDITGFSHQMPPYTPFPSSRPDDLFYGGLRSSMQQSASVAATSHFRPEESRNGPMSLNNSYHESLLSQLPSSRAPSTILSQHQEDYLLAARNSGFNPYAIASSGPLDHSSLHPSMYSHPFASYRSLEEQLYMERYGLLRPGSSGSALPSAIPPYPSLGFPSYLNFRYPSPSLVHPDLGLVNNSLDLNRMKLEEEQRVKERIREEEFAAAAASKSQEIVAYNRPLATVTPRENNATNNDRRERERQREKRRSERDNESNRNAAATVQLPNESSSGRAVKVHTVSPLYASYPVMAEPCTNIADVSAAPEASISPNPPTEEEKRTTEFSRDALEAMAALKQRTLSPPPPEEETTKPEEMTVPLDLSDSSEGSISPVKISQPEISHGNTEAEESHVRSLLDIRVERWKRKRQNSDAGEEHTDEDLDDEMGPALSESLSVEQCLKTYPIPAGVSEEQHNFLHMFGLITPKKRSEFELVKCIRRQNILREPTPPPIDTEDEDSATNLLRQRTRFAAGLIRPVTESQVKDPAIKNFASSLNLYPTDLQTLESVEKSWSIVIADRMKRHFGQKQNVRKRLWSDTLQPLNFDSIPSPINGQKRDQAVDQTLEETGQLKLMPNQILPQPPATSFSKPLMTVANLAKLELSDAGSKTTERSNEVSKLTSEVAFWLRHLKPTMARTLTSSSIKENSRDSTKSDEGSSAENSDGELPTRWPGTDSIMVLYMAHQQDLLLETKFLREHCERLHVQLAEGQATLSKLCLALSSSVEVQRRCKEEDTSTLQSISELQSTLKLLQSL